MTINKDDFREILTEINNLKGKTRKKKINSKAKGNRGENQIIKQLEKRFVGHKFLRTPDSGARVGGQNFFKNIGLEQNVINMLSSDIITPEKFKFELESKKYNQDSVRLFHFFVNKDTHPVNDWWREVVENSLKTNREPMLIVALDKAKPVCFIRSSLINHENVNANYLLWKNNLAKETLIVIELTYLLENFGEDFWGI